MKILIVDNEIASIHELTRIMTNFGECEAVHNGKEAIAKFHEGHHNNHPFGLILLEIDLPEMDGIRVLSMIREAEKNLAIPRDQEAKILMATSHRDKNFIIACIQAGCNDYIGKPFDVVLISKKLSKLGIRERISPIEKNDAKNAAFTNTVQFFEDIASFLPKGKINLPSLPKIRIKFHQMTTTGAEFNSIADLLKKDMAISAELIRMSNSAYYKGITEIKSLEQAVSRVGIAATEQVVDELSRRESFAMKEKKYRSLIENVWKHSIACAYTAELAAGLINAKTVVDPFTMGLFHDIGKLALLQMIAQMEHRGKFKQEIDTAILVRTITDNHCLFGAKLLEKWKSAKAYIHIVLHHGSLIRQDDGEEEKKIATELLIVHFANLLSKSIGYDLHSDGHPDIDLVEIESTQQLSLGPQQIAEIKEKVTGKMKAALELL
jgi:putative nucleotidyltransferase with HDIG domain